MGKCTHCNKQITLGESLDERNCPYCGKDPYQCWNCHEKIDTTKTECPVCGYFRCDECGVCGKNCTMPEQIKTIQELLDKNASAEEIAMATMNFLTGRVRKICPSRKVPISYGHGNRLKSILVRLKGYNVRDAKDLDEWQKIYDKLLCFHDGEKWTVEKIRGNGRDGKEEREISYLMVCQGKAEANTIPKKDGDGNQHVFTEFTRRNYDACIHLNTDDIITKKCPSCKTIYPKDARICTTCTYKKNCKSGTVGDAKLLKISKSKVDVCQFPRKNFCLAKDGVNDGNTGKS